MRGGNIIERNGLFLFFRIAKKIVQLHKKRIEQRVCTFVYELFKKYMRIVYAMGANKKKKTVEKIYIYISRLLNLERLHI